MNCKNCNSSLEEGTTFCPNCGQAVNEEIVEEVTNAATTVNNTSFSEKKNNKAPLIIGIIAGCLIILGILILVAIKFVMPIFNNKSSSDNKPETKTEAVKTIELDEYTFTLPEGFSVLEPNGVKVVGNENFYFVLDNARISESTYDDLLGTKYYIALELSKTLKDMNYISADEEIHNGQKYLIFRFSYTQSGETYYYDCTYTELPDGAVLIMCIDYIPNYKSTGYNTLSTFIKSAKSKKSDTKIGNDTVIGSTELGYLKLPGTWYRFYDTTGNKSGLQYTKDSIWIVSIDTIDVSSTSTAELLGKTAIYSMKYGDNPATKAEGAKIKVAGYDGYQAYGYYASENKYLVEWFFEPGDGKVHYISVEGPDASSDNFKIPDTFSLTKIN